MKIDATELYERATSVRGLQISPTMNITVVNDTEDAVTGEPSDVNADMMKGMNLLESAYFLHDNFAGDTAFVIETANSFAIVRPPFSELPIYYFEQQNRIKVWAGLDIPTWLQQRPPAFDLDYLAVALHNWSWVTPQTGLKGVKELLSGAILVFDGTDLWQRDLLAHAVAALPPAPATDYAHQVNLIRQLILNSVSHKLGPHIEHAAVLCSGGVDSSVGAVAAGALYPNRTFPLIHCDSEEHLYGDERFYFEAVAKKTGWPTATVDMNEGASRESLSPDLLVPTARPMKSAAALSTMAALKKLAMARGARVMLSGDGGDQLFILNDPTLYCQELVGEAPTLKPKLIATSELANVTRKASWEVAGEALRAQKAGQLRERYFGKLRFPKNPLAVEPAPENTEVVPNGSTLSGLGVSRAFQYFGMRNAELNQVPIRGLAVEERKTFLFWPLVRAAMIAARGHHLKDGRNRALERDAFRHELPPEVYHCFSKGGSRDFAQRYDFPRLVHSLQHSPLIRYGLISEKIDNIENAPDDDTAFALVVARGFADWMELYA
ncbi:asparagine synthase-related protein [Neorhizobium vignae]|uniref:asparagine synthase-related protein n=1 Tax=Neorhizobium vignae TaxID=690585 RepID=UPI0005631F88|nr:asparagine synthase-related protein [Neorhizobium vignae]